MNEKEKKAYDKKYKEAKEKGVPFFPDIIFKDTIVVLIVFIILVALVYFIGAPVEARANPNDTSYTPRPKRHFMNRPFASISALVVVAGIGTLTFLAVKESPPPQEAVAVDQSAALYAKNCANCHGPSMDVPAGTDLHQIIAAGNHQGMPAWGGDLSTDEIDALVGFHT